MVTKQYIVKVFIRIFFRLNLVYTHTSSMGTMTDHAVSRIGNLTLKISVYHLIFTILFYSIMAAKNYVGRRGR